MDTSFLRSSWKFSFSSSELEEIYWSFAVLLPILRLESSWALSVLWHSNYFNRSVSNFFWYDFKFRLFKWALFRPSSSDRLHESSLLCDSARWSGPSRLLVTWCEQFLRIGFAQFSNMLWPCLWSTYRDGSLRFVKLGPSSDEPKHLEAFLNI